MDSVGSAGHFKRNKRKKYKANVKYPDRLDWAVEINTKK
jgi:hypothetical protein